MERDAAGKIARSRAAGNLTARIEGAMEASRLSRNFWKRSVRASSPLSNLPEPEVAAAPYCSTTSKIVAIAIVLVVTTAISHGVKRHCQSPESKRGILRTLTLKRHTGLGIDAVGAVFAVVEVDGRFELPERA